MWSVEFGLGHAVQSSGPYQTSKVLPYYLKLRRPNVFDLIRENKLFTDVPDQVLLLVEFDNELVMKKEEGMAVDESKSEAIMLLVVYVKKLDGNSVAEVQSRTVPENQNWLNRTAKFSSVLFSSPGSCACSVLSSQIWPSCQNWVRTDFARSNYIVCIANADAGARVNADTEAEGEAIHCQREHSLRQDKKTSVNIFCTIPTTIAVAKIETPGFKFPLCPYIAFLPSHSINLTLVNCIKPLYQV
ncbi:hypothetical protein JOM56_015500 [Amanita muscaria]